MAQTLTQLYVHIVFSTKNRIDLILPEIEQELFAYIGGITRNNDSQLIAAGGIANHVHLLVSISKNIMLSKLVGTIKRDSSLWIKTKGSIFTLFRWQDGYGAFSVGHTQVEDVKRYIDNQKAHHLNSNFEDEIRYFLNKYDVEYDDQFIWG